MPKGAFSWEALGCTPMTCRVCMACYYNPVTGRCIFGGPFTLVDTSGKEVEPSWRKKDGS